MALAMAMAMAMALAMAMAMKNTQQFYNNNKKENKWVY